MRENLIKILDTHCDYAGHVDCKDDCTECLANHLIANGVTVQQWIPVTERLPEPNKLVLCWWESGDGEWEQYGFATFQRHGVWYVSNEGMPKVTHWMPLPQPPKEG